MCPVHYSKVRLPQNPDYDAKIVENKKKICNHDKSITTIDFNKFSSAIFDGRLKQAKLSTGINLNTVEQRAIKNEEKIQKLQTFELGCFLGTHFFGDILLVLLHSNI